MLLVRTKSLLLRRRFNIVYLFSSRIPQTPSTAIEHYVYTEFIRPERDQSRHG